MGLSIGTQPQPMFQRNMYLSVRQLINLVVGHCIFTIGVNCFSSIILFIFFTRKVIGCPCLCLDGTPIYCGQRAVGVVASHSSSVCSSQELIPSQLD